MTEETFLKHQIRIAKDTIKMNDTMANIMGGMTKDEAKRILYNNGHYSFPPPPVPTRLWNEKNWFDYIDKYGRWK